MVDVLSFSPYLLLLVTASALVTAVITGGKYFYKRYTDGLDRRIDGCIGILTKKNVYKLHKLERKINVLISLVVPQDKIDILKNIEVEKDE